MEAGHDVPEEVKKSLKFYWVETATEVLDMALGSFLVLNPLNFGNGEIPTPSTQSAVSPAQTQATPLWEEGHCVTH